MANTKSAAKRARQAKRRTTINRIVKSKVKNALKGVLSALETGNKAEAAELATKAQSALDKATKTGQIHKNKAARQKSRIAAKLAALK